MYIDIRSIIIGGVLWELLSTYLDVVVRPYIRKRKYEKEQEEKSKNKDHKKDNKKIGYTAD